MTTANILSQPPKKDNSELTLAQIYIEVTDLVRFEQISKIHLAPYVDSYRSIAWLTKALKNHHARLNGRIKTRPSRKGKTSSDGQPRKRDNYAASVASFALVQSWNETFALEVA